MPRKGGKVSLPSMSEVKNVLNNLHDEVKKNQIISKSLTSAGFAVPGTLAGALGYGRKKRAKRRGGRVALPSVSQVKNVLGNLHDQVKKNQIISKALGSAGFTIPSVMASSLGYGRKKARRRGRGFLDFVKGVVNAPLYGISGVSAGLQQGISGLGRRRGGMRMSGNVAPVMIVS